MTLSRDAVFDCVYKVCFLCFCQQLLSRAMSSVSSDKDRFFNEPVYYEAPFGENQVTFRLIILFG